MRSRKRFAFAAPAFLFLSTFLVAADEPQPAHVYVTFQGASSTTLSTSKAAEIELNFKVKDGFHVNSNKPNSELLIPTTLKLQPPSDLSTAGITFPVGKDISFPFDPTEKLNVYSDEFTVKAKLMAAHSATTGNFTVHGELRYQACSDNACYPPKTVPFQFDVHVVGASSRAHGGTPQSPHIR